MHEAAIAGAAFLLAVLWFDLMFDVQVRLSSGPALPEAVLLSIASYYRRVTTDARPMNRLISLVMLVTLGTAIGELVFDRGVRVFALLSLACVAGAIGLAATRTVPNAVTMGKGAGTHEERSRRARSIYRDHLICFAAMSAFCLLQLVDQLGVAGL
jgi:hypothetical protein